jgi:hypothetical protein
MKWMFAFLLAGCSGGAFSATLLEAKPMSLVVAHDWENDLTLRVRYQHPSALLGDGVAEIRDSRAADLVTRLTIPPIASDEAKAAGVPIAGELDLLVADVGGATGQASFCVRLIDSAGTQAEAGCSDPIEIK